MVAYGIAKARAMANRTDWNERTEITKAVITWFDENYEYDLEIENEDRMDDEEFTAWVEKNAEDLAKADAEENETIFEGIDRIDFKENYIDDDALCHSLQQDTGHLCSRHPARHILLCPDIQQPGLQLRAH